MITSTQLIMMACAAIMTSAISGMIGMAGGVILLGILTFFMPYTVLIPFHGAIQLVSNFTRSVVLYKSIKREIFFYYALTTPIGALFAYYFLKSIKNPEYCLIGVAIVLAYTLVRTKRKKAGVKMPFIGFLGVGLVSGFLGPLIGATGPLLASFFVRDDLKKEEIVATKASCQAICHLVKFPVFFGLGVNYFEFWDEFVIMAVCTIIGTKIGTILLGKISDKFFRRAFLTLLFVAFCRILYKVGLLIFPF